MEIVTAYLGSKTMPANQTTGIEIQDHHREDNDLPYWLYDHDTKRVRAKCADRLQARALKAWIEGYESDDDEVDE